jgi:hypothetical protein
MLSIKLYVGDARCTIIMYPKSMEKEAQALCFHRNWLHRARPPSYSQYVGKASTCQK